MPPNLHQLYDEHAASVFGFVLNLTRSEPDTRDVLQELFLKIAARPDQLAAVRQPRAWLLRLAHNLAIDSLRRRTGHDHAIKRAAAEPALLFTPAPNPDETSYRNALSAALAELPAEQRAVVHLKLWDDLTFAEIADALGIPPNTAASRYRYGIDKLQTLLRPIYEELP